jgi:hypothetical protein
LTISRGYLKLPICYSFMRHMVILYLNEKKKSQINTIYPKVENNEFSTYKEKVLFILNNLISMFGRTSVLVDPNNDLIWCAFVIENDYLQISNSISSA